MSCEMICPIFNFNVYDCYNLEDNMNYVRPMSDTNLYLDPNNGIISFKYCKPRTIGGIKIKLGTIPGEIYHVYATGQLILGDGVSMSIENHEPIINLAKPQKWNMGYEEVKTMTFTALTHQLYLTITTPKSCYIDNSPYEFVLSYLYIIPQSLSCQGFIKGITGTTGDIGPIGYTGYTGETVIGETGIIGEIGPNGDKGMIGITGETGFIGRIGSIGGIGLLGVQSELRGYTGDQGVPGMQGAIGLMGFQGIIGVQGTQGPQGMAAYRLNDNVIINQFQLKWTRGGPVIGINTITYEKVNNMIMMRMSGFATVGSSGFNLSALNSTSIPNIIRTLEFRNSLFPAIIQIGPDQNNLITKNVIIEIGPTIIIIYSDLNKNTNFDKSEVVFFPEQTFIYYKDDVNI